MMPVTIEGMHVQNPHVSSAAINGTSSANTAASTSSNTQDPNRKKTTGPLHNPRYKSILCDHWERNNGVCPYAEKCQFAHGPAELAKWQAHRARQQQMQQHHQQHLVHHEPKLNSPQAQLSQQQSGRYVHGNMGMSPQTSPAFTHQHSQHQISSIPLHLSPSKPTYPTSIPGPTDPYGVFSQTLPSSPPSMLYQKSSTPPQQPFYSTPFQSNNMFQTLGGDEKNYQKFYSNTNVPIVGARTYQTNSTGNSSSQPQTPQQQQPSSQQNIQSQQLQHKSSFLQPLSQSQQQHVPLFERSTSPLEQRSLSGETPVRTGDPRRTASLPQLFSTDFLSSSLLAASKDYDYGASRVTKLPSPPPQEISYPNYRRGSAPPVVLSVATNSLADLDSLADELVSEPNTSTSQLFSMPTVFPGSINEYL